MKITHRYLYGKSGRILSCCTLVSIAVLAFAAQAPAQDARILAFDDFSGPAGDLNGRVTPRGGAEWFTQSDTRALVLDGQGRAVVSKKNHRAGGRNHAWLEALPDGDEYYVAARIAYAGGGWGAIGFAGMTGNKEPLLASALFAVQAGKRGGVAWIWIDREQVWGPSAEFHQIPAFANFIPGEPGTIAIAYNTSTGTLQFLYNDHVVYETERFDLPVGRAIMTFHVTGGADTGGNFFDSLVVANRPLEMPEDE